MNFIRYFLIIFVILFQMSQEKKVYGIEISGIHVPDEVLREIVEWTPHPWETLESFKMVSRGFYHFVYQEFFRKKNQVCLEEFKKDGLSIGYQYDVGAGNDKARELEKETTFVSSDSFILPWKFQIWMDSIFIDWFKTLGLLTRFQLAQDSLKDPSYIQVEFLKHWI